MAHITLSLDEETYGIVKKHPEINWSEIARRSIKKETTRINGIVKGKDFFDNLPEETKNGIKEISKFPKSSWKKYYKGMKEKEWNRAKLSIRAY